MIANLQKDEDGYWTWDELCDCCNLLIKIATKHWHSSEPNNSKTKCWKCYLKQYERSIDDRASYQMSCL